MLHLLKIDLKKLTSYRTFWVICGLYFFTLGTSTASGMEFLKWAARTIENFGQEINVSRIPLYHFPDIWMNLAFFSGLFKIVLAIMVVISITNEYSYRTLRQNIIDGMSRWEFLASKIMTNLLLSFMSLAMVFVITVVTGLIYTPNLSSAKVFTDMEFFITYFLEVFAFLSYALMIGVLVQRSGLTIVLLLLSHAVEAVIKYKIIGDSNDWFFQFLPMDSISNLVPVPYYRYWFQEIRDYITVSSVAIALAWIFLFNYFSYLKLKRADI